MLVSTVENPVVRYAQLSHEVALTNAGEACSSRSFGIALLIGCWTPLRADPQPLDQRDPLEKEQRADALLATLRQLRTRVDASSQQVSLQEAIALGLRNNPELVAAFRAIQQYEWQLIAAQR